MTTTNDPIEPREQFTFPDMSDYPQDGYGNMPDVWFCEGTEHEEIEDDENNEDE